MSSPDTTWKTEIANNHAAFAIPFRWQFHPRELVQFN
jgi:hypothetical protein